MPTNTTPHDPIPVEQLAEIVDRVRADNGDPTGVSRDQLASDLEHLYRDIFAAEEDPEPSQPTAWDMISEEVPEPARRYKIFKKALDANDPLATLRDLSHDRSPSEFYLLKTRIKSFARSKRPTVEAGLPDLQTADWGALSNEQQKTIRKHLSHLETFYYNTQKRNTDPMENRIKLAVYELADMFARYTHFDGISTDLPNTATSRFIQFACLALAPVVHANKLSPDAVSMRWRRLKGPTDHL